MRLVCLSDTHLLHDRIAIPEGDVLLHAGDFTMGGTVSEVREFMAWYGSLPHRHKILIAGNHDFLFENDPVAARRLIPEGVHYLEDSGTEIDGVRFWGSPWQPWFFDWAFNLPRNGLELREKWWMIPAETDVLITHGPPHGMLDRVHDGTPVGCEELAAAIPRLDLRLHLFGHIHEGYGRSGIFVNASNCDLRYRAVNPAVVVEI